MSLTRSAYLCVAVLLVSLCGCGNDDSPDGLTKQLISKMNQLSAAIESKKSDQDIEGLQADLAAIAKKMDALNLSDKEKAELETRHQDAIEEARSRMTTLLMKDLPTDVGDTPEPAEEQKKNPEMDNTLEGVGN